MPVLLGEIEKPHVTEFVALIRVLVLRNLIPAVNNAELKCRQRTNGI